MPHTASHLTVTIIDILTNHLQPSRLIRVQCSRLQGLLDQQIYFPEMNIWTFVTIIVTDTLSVWLIGDMYIVQCSGQNILRNWSFVIMVRKITHRNGIADISVRTYHSLPGVESCVSSGNISSFKKLVFYMDIYIWGYAH